MNPWEISSRAMRSLTLLVVITAALVSAEARADVIPPPTRPAWDEHPAPLPTPPEDRTPLVVGLAVSAGSLAVATWWSRRERSA